MATPNKKSVAKVSAPVEEPVKNALTTGIDNALQMPVLSADEMASMTEGVQENFNRDDLRVPFFKILQKMSPQLDKNAPEYIEGAEEGMFHNTATGELYDGEAGITVVPIKYMRNVTLWKPRKKGGGMVRDYGQDTRVLLKAKETIDGEGKRKLVDDEGNEFLDSAMFFCLLLQEDKEPEQIVVLMTGMSWKAAKSWNTRLDRLTMAVGTKVHHNLPLYFTVWKLSAQYDKNDSGSFYKHAVPEMEAWTANINHGKDLVAHARLLRLKIDAGEVRAQSMSDDAGDEVPF